MSLALFQTVGPLELLIVLGVVLLIFGPKRLPALGRQLGPGRGEVTGAIRRQPGVGGVKHSISAKPDEGDEGDETRALGQPEHDTPTPSTADEAVPEKR